MEYSGVRCYVKHRIRMILANKSISLSFRATHNIRNTSQKASVAFVLQSYTSPLGLFPFPQLTVPPIKSFSMINESQAKLQYHPTHSLFSSFWPPSSISLPDLHILHSDRHPVYPPTVLDSKYSMRRLYRFHFHCLTSAPITPHRYPSHKIK
jgi:hypothetical protein